MAHTAVDLRIEYLKNPLGIDVETPHFSWRMECAEDGACQSAYELTVSSDNEVVWSSGKVESAESIQIAYAGPALRSRTKYEVSVVTYDGTGRAGIPATGWFETGLGRSKWKNSDWIRGAYVESAETGHAKGGYLPVYYFRQEFALKAKPVRARLYATALGLFEGFCNGKLVSDEQFAPGWTDYCHRVQYRTYDVTEMLTGGKNALGFKLGSGWYAGHISSAWIGGLPGYGDIPRLRAMLICDYEDGHSEVFGTDESWKVTSDGPERFSDIYDGETYDDRLALDGFATAGFPTQGWGRARIFTAGIPIQGTAYQPVRRTQIMKPVKMFRRHSGDEIIIDFGQNFAGRERIRFNLPEGGYVIVRHGEMLTQDGALYTENLRGARATTTFRSSGREIVYEPTFTFYGFRYLELTGDVLDIKEEDISAVVLHTDMERTGDFSCSNPLLNQLFSNCIWGQRSNYLDVPTDCPQRDERLGWTCDTQVFTRVGSYNYHTGAFFGKYLMDLELCRNEFGEYASYCPNPYWNDGYGDYGAAAWEDAAFICADEIYNKYNDRALLARHYEAMANCVRLRENTAEDLVWDQACFGDWLNTAAPLPPEMVGMAYFAHSADLVAKFARILGRDQDAEEFASLFERIRKKYASMFLDAEGHLRLTWDGTKRSYDAGDSVGVPLSCRTQTGAVLSLRFNLLPENVKGKVLADLVKDIHDHGDHITCGFLGTSYIAQELASRGEITAAYAILEQRSYPSWLYSVDQGATTFWERWNSYSHEKGFGRRSMNSFNHYAYGAIGDFMYEFIGGIRPLTPGFQHFEVKPCPGGSLTAAKAEYRSEYGLISSEWKINGGAFELQVKVPANSVCEVTLPDGQKFEAKAGIHQYSCQI